MLKSIFIFTFLGWTQFSVASELLIKVENINDLSFPDDPKSISILKGGSVNITLKTGSVEKIRNLSILEHRLIFSIYEQLSSAEIESVPNNGAGCEKLPPLDYEQLIIRKPDETKVILDGQDCTSTSTTQPKEGRIRILANRLLSSIKGILEE